MKTWYKQIFLSIIVLSIASSFEGKDMEYEKKKSVTKSFGISENTYVEIENKYGDVEIIGWDKDSVRIEVESIAFSDDNDDLEELLGMLKINFKGNSSFILAETEWQEDVGVLQKGIFQFNKEFVNNVKIEVNYKVYLPTNLDLSITNKFGDIYLTDYEGSLSIDIGYGNLRAHHLSDVNRLKAKFGKVRIKKIDKGNLNFRYAKSVNIEDAGEIVVESASSELTFEHVSDINITSRHDDITIEELDQMIGTVSYTDMYIQEITSKINIVTKSGTFIIKEISGDAEVVRLEGVNTDFRIGYSDVFFGSLEVEASEEESLSYSKTIVLESTERINKDKWIASGYVNKKGDSKLIIVCISGYLQLKGV